MTPYNTYGGFLICDVLSVSYSPVDTLIAVQRPIFTTLPNELLRRQR